MAVQSSVTIRVNYMGSPYLSNKPCDEVLVAAQLIKHVKACKSL